MSLSWILGGEIFSKAIGFIGTIFVLRHLSTEGVALLYPLLGIFHIVNQFGDFGVTTGFIKIGSRIHSTDTKRIPHILRAAFDLKILSATIALLVGLLLAPWISNITFQTTEYAALVRILFVASFFSIMAGYTNSLLQIQEKFKKLSIIKILPPIFKFILIITLFYAFSFKFSHVYFAYLLVPVMTFGLGMVFIPYKQIFIKESTTVEKKKILNVSKWVYISSLAAVGTGQVDILMVRSMLGPVDLANLVGAQKISSFIPLVTATLYTVLLPKISSKVTKKELNYFFRKTLLFIPVIAALYIIAITTADFLIPFVLGDKYLASIPIFKYYAIGLSVSLYIGPTSLILYSLNKEHLFIVVSIFQFLVNIVGNYLLIPIFSASGAAMTSSFIHIIGLIFVLTVLYRENIIFLKQEDR